jgi:hypothetical protein
VASTPEPIRLNAAGVDLSPRFVKSTTVVASPAAAAQTTIATLTIPSSLVQVAGVELVAWAALTVGTNGVSVDLKIRQTDTSGTTIADSGAVTATAANLITVSAHGFDTAGVLPGQVYVATLTVASGSAASTVSAVYLRALVV